MRIAVVTPAAAGSLSGNRLTAQRWATRLRELGHDADVSTSWDGQGADLLVALHATKSAASIRRWRETRGAAPLVIVLTGTDVYGTLREDPAALETLRAATRIVALQGLAARSLPPDLRDRVDVVVQSAVPPEGAERPRTDVFDACVVAHLRPVKDPLRAATAARHLQESSRVAVSHAGEPLDADLAARALREARENPRYAWLGALPREAALRLIARSRVLVVTSRAEGGANVVSEAIACGTPVITSAIEGSLGLLGEDWPATFPVGDDRALARLLHRCETDAAFLADLAARVKALQPRFTPEAERDAWAEALARIPPGAS